MNRKIQKFNLSDMLILIRIGLVFLIIASFMSCKKENIEIDEITKSKLILSPTPFYMGVVPQGTNAVRTAHAFNPNSERISISTYTIEGVDASAFTVINNPELTVSAASSNDFEIQFTSEIPGDYTAIFKLESEAGISIDTLMATCSKINGNKIEFERIYGDDKVEESFKHGIQTSEGGYLYMGNVENQNTTRIQTDVMLVKTNKYGEMQWKKFYGGEYSDEGNKIIETYEGGYMVAGITYSYGDFENGDAFLLNIDSSGKELWQKSYRSSSNSYTIDNIKSIIKTSDNNYLLVGVTTDEKTAEGYVIKVDPQGEVIWQYIHGGAGADQFNDAVMKTNSTNVICVGETTSQDPNYSDYDILIVELDMSGNLLKTYRYGNSIRDNAYAITSTVDGGYALAGVAVSSTNAVEAYVLKVDGNFEKQWDFEVGTEFNDRFNDIIEDRTGNIIATGLRIHFRDDQKTYTNIMVQTLSSSGTSLDFIDYGGPRSESCSSIEHTSDGGYILVGGTDNYSTTFDALALKWLSKN
jgi:hypothetical protein